jgi:hypothetical protein
VVVVEVVVGEEVDVVDFVEESGMVEDESYCKSNSS